MASCHHREIDAAHHTTEREHRQNGGFKEAPIDGIGCSRSKLGAVGFERGGTSRFLQFGDQTGFVDPVGTSEEPERLLWAQLAAAAGQTITVEYRPAGRILAENDRELHLARNQRSSHAPIVEPEAS